MQLRLAEGRGRGGVDRAAAVVVGHLERAQAFRPDERPADRGADQDADRGLAPLGQPDHDRELSVVLDEVAGAVEGVDEPHRRRRPVPCVRRRVALLGDERNPREVGLQGRADERVGLAIGSRDRIVLRLEVDVEGGRVDAHDDGARAARDGQHVADEAASVPAHGARHDAIPTRDRARGKAARSSSGR